MHSILRSNELFHKKEGWLDTCWHFSFSEYYDPKNLGWGILRVFNDDHIAPGGVFNMHPHANYEIITIVLEGELEHNDSHLNSGIIHPNQVQIMSAGNGILHSEANAGKTMLHLLQIWLTPAQKGGEPSWASHKFNPSDFKNKLLPIVSGSENENAPLVMRQNATLYRSILDKNKSVSHSFENERGYLFIISGELSVGKEKLLAGDSMRIKGEKKTELTANPQVDFILFDLP